MDNRGQTRIDLTSEDGNINDLIARNRTRALALGVRDRDIVIIISENQRHALIEHLHRNPQGRRSADYMRGTDSFTYMGVSIEVLSYPRPGTFNESILGEDITTIRLPGMVDGEVVGREPFRWLTRTNFTGDRPLDENELKTQLDKQDSDTLDRLVDFINNTIRDRVEANRRKA